MAIITIQDIVDNIIRDNSLLIIYAKKGCRLCGGKGYIIYQANTKAIEQNLLCKCVLKKIKQEVNEINHGVVDQ